MIDLKALAGGKYRLGWDESATIPGQSGAERAWLRQIPCKYGHIYVHGPDLLGAYCSSGRVKGRLLAVPGVRLHQNGDREFSATFPPAQLAQVAQILRARKRRVLTAEQKARLLAAGARTRLAPRRPDSVPAPDSGPGVPGGGNAPPGAGDAPGA